MQQVTELTDNECHKGVISKDRVGNIRFEENVDATRSWERNPRIFEGRFVNMSRKKDGSLKFSFRRVNTDAMGFKASDYAFNVYSELINALQSIS